MKWIVDLRLNSSLPWQNYKQTQITPTFMPTSAPRPSFDNFDEPRKPELKVESAEFDMRLAEVLEEGIEGQTELEVRQRLERIEVEAEFDYGTVVTAKQTHHELRQVTGESGVHLNGGPNVTGILERAEETRMLKTALGKNRSTALPWYEAADNETIH